MRLPYLQMPLVVVAVLAAASATRSADPPAATPEQKVLDKWLGSWRTSYKLPKAEWTPEEKKGTAELTDSRVVGGQFVQEKGEHSDKTSSILMLTYDAEKKCYRSWWFSSTGQTAEATGKWDADTKTMTWSSVGEPAFTTTTHHRFVDDDTVEWDVVIKEGTAKVLFRMEGKSVRVKEPKK
jgi:Protein of unknown function (DUF1579)